MKNSNKHSKVYPKGKKKDVTKAKRQSPRSSDPNDCKSGDNVHVSGNINDASYYFSNELLKNQLANISFNQFTGVPVPVGFGYLGTSVNLQIPSVMTIHLNPSAGFTNAATGLGNALNLTSLGLYTELSANNAKTTNYAPQDITTLFLALGSAISLYSHMTRVFGTAYLYSQRNRAYPKSIIEAMGVDYDDLMANFANYRARFNTIINAANKIAFPSNVTYFKKCAELYSGLYVDMEGSSMAQTYALVPNSIWLFDETGSDEGTVLRTYDIADTTIKPFSTYLGALDNVFEALLSSSTLNYIYADILRLADKGLGLYRFEGVPDGYTVIPTYNPEIRKWINNLTVMGEPLTGDDVDETYTTSNNVYPDADTNKIVYRPQFKHAFGSSTLDKILNFDYGEYTSDDIIYATRLMCHAEYDTEAANGKTLSVALPDHYTVRIVLHYPNNTVRGISQDSIYFDDVQMITGLSAFDWAPMFPIQDSVGGPAGYLGDLNYYTVLDFKYLSRLQDSTYFGLFEIR